MPFDFLVSILPSEHLSLVIGVVVGLNLVYITRTGNTHDTPFINIIHSINNDLVHQMVIGAYNKCSFHIM